MNTEPNQADKSWHVIKPKSKYHINKKKQLYYFCVIIKMFHYIQWFDFNFPLSVSDHDNKFVTMNDKNQPGFKNFN